MVVLSNEKDRMVPGKGDGCQLLLQSSRRNVVVGGNAVSG